MTYFAVLQRRVTQPCQNPTAVSKEDVQHAGGPFLNRIAGGVPKPLPLAPVCWWALSAAARPADSPVEPWISDSCQSRVLPFPNQLRKTRAEFLLISAT